MISSSELIYLREIAEELATDGAEFILASSRQCFARDDQSFVQTKSSRTDPVTRLDRETEQRLRRRLASIRPEDAILGEEGGGVPNSDTLTWIIDPIDGTVNFLYGIPAYTVSVAALLHGHIVVGAVADVVHGHLYSAALGLGAYQRCSTQQIPLQCSTTQDLTVALCGTGFGYSASRRVAQSQLLTKIIAHVRDIRRLGSAALDLCMVACGKLDLYYEHGIKIWDYAAGVLIAAEAGAYVHTPSNLLALSDDAALVVASAPGVSQEFMSLLDQYHGLAILPTKLQ